jgi:phosphatidylinositol kinase/protein kinase (PI-3  family)
LIEKRLDKFENIFLENVSKDLLNFKNSELYVPGCTTDIKIKKIHSVLKVLKSKRKPRKLALYGSNNKKYFFLLKGNEDLR